jgi:hypothetical protein
MKTKMCLALVLLCLVGCENPQEQFAREKKEWIEKTKRNAEIVVIDGCEYFLIFDIRSADTLPIGITHKGNCSNPIHSKQLEK